MAYDGSELEAWKLAVARATAYVQSNASFQIQLFGFFSSAVVIGIGLSSDGANGQTDSLELSNKTFMLMYVVPLFSLMILYVSGYYFNRLTTQHVFIRLYGHNFDPLTYVKSADQLWDNFQNQNNVTHVRAVRYLFSSDYTGPYPAFFLLYIIVGLVSFFYNFTVHGQNYFGLGQYIPYMILLLVVIVIFISETTMRAWRVIDYELKVKQGYPLLQNSSSTVPVVLDLKLKF